MMRKLRTTLMLALAITVGTAADQGPAITAADAWVAEPAAAATTALAYLTVNNPTMYDIYVVSATSTAAEKIELRKGSGESAKPVKEITVSSYGFAELKAGEDHLALVNLKRPLKAGDTVDLTLMTEGGVKLVLAALVKKPQ